MTLRLRHNLCAVLAMAALPSAFARAETVAPAPVAKDAPPQNGGMAQPPAPVAAAPVMSPLDPAKMPNCKSDALRDALSNKKLNEDQNREVWTLEQVSVVQSDLTPDLKAALEKAHTFDALVTELNNRHIPFKRVYNCLDTATFPSAVMTKIRALPSTEPWGLPIGDRIVFSLTLKKESASEAKDHSLSPLLTEQQERADKLLSTLGMEREFKAKTAELLEQLLPRLIRKNTAREAELRKIVSDELGAMILKTWPVIHARYRDLYAQNFTADELKQLTAFYASNLGRKVQTVLPGMQQSMFQVRQQALKAALEAAQPRILQKMREAKMAVPSMGT